MWSWDGDWELRRVSRLQMLALALRNCMFSSINVACNSYFKFSSVRRKKWEVLKCRWLLIFNESINLPVIRPTCDPHKLLDCGSTWDFLKHPLCYIKNNYKYQIVWRKYVDKFSTKLLHNKRRQKTLKFKK